ncbi:MAG: FAD-binding oxidoreductase [Pseudomonadota bacterium]
MTADPPKTADAVVIGGGLIGLFTAIGLAEKGLSVVILERDRLGAHASGLHAGGVRRIGRDPAELPIAEAAMAIWRDAETAIGKGCGFTASGHVLLAETEAERTVLEAREEDLCAAKLSIATWLDAGDLARLVPSMRTGPLAALYAEGDGFANPAGTLSATIAKAEAIGVQCVENAEVLGIDHAGDTLRVSTAAGTVTAGCVVNAAGASGGRVARIAGDRLPVIMEAPMAQRTVPLPAFLGPVIQTIGRKLTLKQQADGRLLIGGGHRGVIEDEGWRAEAIPSEGALNRATVEDLFPHTRPIVPEAVWAGLDGYTPDRLPIIDKGGLPGLVHAIAFSGHGFQLAPAIGPVVADLATGVLPAFDLAPFRADRFTDMAALDEVDVRVG